MQQKTNNADTSQEAQAKIEPPPSTKVSFGLQKVREQMQQEA
jgi:hypothetical protein